jgi:hypothetical protein
MPFEGGKTRRCDRWMGGEGIFADPETTQASM